MKNSWRYTQVLANIVAVPEIWIEYSNFHTKKMCWKILFAKSGQFFLGLHLLMVNSLWPSDTIWQHRNGSTLAQVMVWFRSAPSYYLNQYWCYLNGFYSICIDRAIFQEVLMMSICKMSVENHTLNITSTSPTRGQWINSLKSSDTCMHQWARPSLV